MEWALVKAQMEKLLEVRLVELLKGNMHCHKNVYQEKHFWQLDCTSNV